MNKDLLKIALIGLAAGFCISAKDVPAKRNQEVAMSKCTKENGSKEKCKKKKCGSSCSNENNGCNARGTGCNTSARCNNYSTEDFQPNPKEIAAKRKSAAQKVMEGY
jgi:hypothetical protein